MQTSLSNPLEIKTALYFGALLTLVMLLGRALQTWQGDAGVLMLATVSGVADVDAITLSLARMSQGELTSRVAVMAIFIGGGRIGLRVSVPLLASAVIGLLATWVLVW